MATKTRSLPTIFQSKFESTVYKALRKFTKRIEYETEQLDYTIPARKAKYTPDFILIGPKGHKIYIETKGYLRPADRTKMLRVKRSNPKLDIRMIFMRDNKIKGTKMRYSDWAMRHGFPYAIGDKDEVIEQWVKELNKR